MKKEKIKSLVILCLIICVIALGVVILLPKVIGNNSSQNQQFLKDFQKVQSSLSYYLGKTSSDTFGIYNNNQILSGTAENVEIKDNKDVALVKVTKAENKLEKNKKVCYQIIDENIKTALKIDMPKYENITWYVQDGELLKVNFETQPEWWTSDLDVLKVGQ